MACEQHYTSHLSDKPNVSLQAGAERFGIFSVALKKNLPAVDQSRDSLPTMEEGPAFLLPQTPREDLCRQTTITTTERP
jgi:hypothetical protein